TAGWGRRRVSSANCLHPSTTLLLNAFATIHSPSSRRRPPSSPSCASDSSSPPSPPLARCLRQPKPNNLELTVFADALVFAWVAMEKAEKELYKEALTLSMKSREFFEFSKIHMDTMSEMQAHSTCAFLLWHKRYLLAFENMLRSQGDKFACVTIPYWDVMSEYADMVDGKCSNIMECSAIVADLSGKSMGQLSRTFNGEKISGECYQAFAGDDYCDDNGECGCVPRSGIATNQIPVGCGYTSLFNQIAYSRSFAEFTKALQNGAHNELHSQIGGHMGTMASPSDFIFWSWHAAIDMMLYTFHQCHVPSSMTEEELRKNIYGFTQDGSCQYSRDAPEASVNGKFVQQSDDTVAAKNKLIGKYFDGLGDSIADYISFHGLGENAYSYEVPAPFKEQLLQSEDYCRVYWKEWSDKSKKQVDPNETLAPGTVQPGTVAPSNAGSRTGPSSAPGTRKPTPSKSKGKKKKPSSGSGNSSAAGDVDVGDEDQVDWIPGVGAPSSSGSGAALVSKNRTRSRNSTSSYGKQSYNPTAKPYQYEVTSYGKVDTTKSKYWNWYGGCKKELENVYPGNITEISKQLDYLGCMTFSTEFGIANLTEQFITKFKINQTRPLCGRKVDQVQKGEVKVVLETKAFAAEKVAVLPGVTPAPAVKKEDAYKQYEAQVKTAADEGDKYQKKQSSASIVSACTTVASWAMEKEKEKKRSYTVEEKLAIVQAAKTESLRAVARRYNVDRNCIRAWREKETQLAELHPYARRLPGAGRRPGVTNERTAAKRKAATAAATANTATTAAVAMAGSTGAAAVGATSMTARAGENGDKELKRPACCAFVGFQGKEGAFSDVAARLVFEELKQLNTIPGVTDYETIGFAHIGHVFESIENRDTDYGVLPVENSTSGTFHGILDRLISSNLRIVGEIACLQELCLCAIEGAKVEDISCLLSHPAVLDHCEEFIANLELKNETVIDRQATWDSAGACQIVHHEGSTHVGAIASEQAAITHGLQVLEKGVGDELNNETRYVILARQDAAPLRFGLRPNEGSTAKMKASIVIAVPNEPQALFKIVAAFALRNLTIIKIESRPAATAGGLFSSQTHHWDYIFYVDYVVSADPSINEHLRRNLEEFALWIKDLGTYYATSGLKTNVEPPRWKRICNVITC
ncbi:TPA: LOW QUALITY PROTEIN: hypothetical protein N0F65_003483, partial [Lagenidium giganteum]